MLHFRNRTDVANLRVYDATVGTGDYSDPFKKLGDFDDLGDCHLDVGSTLGLKSVWLQVSLSAGVGPTAGEIRYYREFQPGEFALLFLNYNHSFSPSLGGLSSAFLDPTDLWTGQPPINQPAARAQIVSGLASRTIGPAQGQGHILFLDTVPGPDGAAFADGGFTFLGSGVSKFAFRTYASYVGAAIQSATNFFLLDEAGVHNTLAMNWPFNARGGDSTAPGDREIPHAWWEWDGIPRQPQRITGASPSAGYAGPSPEKFGGWPATHFGNSGIVRAFPATYGDPGPPTFAAISTLETYINTNNGDVYEAQGTVTNWVLLGNISVPGSSVATSIPFSSITGWQNSALIKAGLESTLQFSSNSGPYGDGYWPGIFLKFSMDEDISTYQPNHNLGY